MKLWRQWRAKRRHAEYVAARLARRRAEDWRVPTDQRCSVAHCRNEATDTFDVHSTPIARVCVEHTAEKAMDIKIQRDSEGMRMTGRWVTG